jgi:hypothetical protein
MAPAFTSISTLPSTGNFRASLVSISVIGDRIRAVAIVPVESAEYQRASTLMSSVARTRCALCGPAGRFAVGSGSLSHVWRVWTLGTPTIYHFAPTFASACQRKPHHRKTNHARLSGTNARTRKKKPGRNLCARTEC